MKGYFFPKNLKAASVMHEIEGCGVEAYDSCGNVVKMLDCSKSFHPEVKQYACHLCPKYIGFRSKENAMNGNFILFDGQGREWKKLNLDERKVS